MKRYASELTAERMRKTANVETTQTISVRLKADELRAIDSLCERLAITRANFFRFCFFNGLEELNELRNASELKRYVKEGTALNEYQEPPTDLIGRLLAKRINESIKGKK